MAVKYKLYGYILPPYLNQAGLLIYDDSRGRFGRHRHGIYATHELAEWWAINSKGVWKGGDEGPKEVFYPVHRICYWYITSFDDGT